MDASPHPGAEKIYQALEHQAQQIRVLVVQPAATIDLPICCDFRILSLTEAQPPKYEALSYCWGSAARTHLITLGQVSWAVPVSVDEAIRGLRSKDEGTLLTIWIDYLCINQEDITEREHQIGLMDQIYHKAWRVVMWLGLEDEGHASPAFTLFDRLSKAEKWSTIFPTKSAGVDNPLGNYDALSSNTIMDTFNFFHTKWWTRLWTIQEAVLGTTVLFRWGHDQILLDACFAAYDTFRNNLLTDAESVMMSVGPMYLLNLTRQFDEVEMLKQFKNLARKIQACEAHNDRRAVFMIFCAVLAKCRYRSATDDRDRVYGLLGLFPGYIKNAVRPSYSDTKAVVWKRTAKVIIEQSQNYMIFNHRFAHGSDTSQLAKWIPNWSSPAYLNNDFVRIDQRNLFTSSGNRPFNIEFEGNSLLVDAIIVDRIVAIERLTETVGDDSELYRHAILLGNMLADVTLGTSAAKDGIGRGRLLDKDTQCHLWEVLLNDCVPEMQGGQRKLRRLRDTERAAIQANSEKLMEVHAEIEELARTLPHIPQQELYDHVRGVAQMKNAFITELGYIGLYTCVTSVLSSSDQEDIQDLKVCVLAGGSHPVILRGTTSADDLFEAYSEAYVHGIMDGQVPDGRAMINPIMFDHKDSGRGTHVWRGGDEDFVDQARRTAATWRKVVIT